MVSIAAVMVGRRVVIVRSLLIVGDIALIEVNSYWLLAEFSEGSLLGHSHLVAFTQSGALAWDFDFHRDLLVVLLERGVWVLHAVPSYLWLVAKPITARQLGVLSFGFG